ncbi:hypothetical protein C0J52_25294 [Blattella germanica]|nr:hypothetical protein C0J52_25294 [Blattella germanica]
MQPYFKVAQMKPDSSAGQVSSQEAMSGLSKFKLINPYYVRILNIQLSDRTFNVGLRKRTGIQDAAIQAQQLKWRWAGHTLSLIRKNGMVIESCMNILVVLFYNDLSNIFGVVRIIDLVPAFTKYRNAHNHLELKAKGIFRVPREEQSRILFSDALKNYYQNEIL